MEHPTITLEIRGGPNDGATYDLGPPAVDPAGYPNMAMFGVPLHPTDKPYHYIVHWSDIESLAARAGRDIAADLKAKSEILRRMLDGDSLGEINID